MKSFEALRSSTRAANCVACGKCTTMCPLASQSDFSARRIVGQELRHHEAGAPVGVERCLSCGNCELRCPQGVRITELVRGLRELLPDQDRRRVPHGGVFQAASRIQRAHERNPGPPAWLGEDLRVREQGEIALFVGCLPLFDLYFQDSLHVEMLEIARSAIRILNHLGIEPVLAGDELCCGHDLLWSGDRESFQELARGNADTFEQRGVKHIVTTCAECCSTWRLDYPQAVPGYRPRVEHITEFLAAHPISLRSNTTLRLSYQDPCRLGRHLGVVDAPRSVLNGIDGVEVSEMERSGADAVCCGTSGFIHCDAQSKRLQRERLISAASTGATTLATACPKCLIHFRCALAEDERCGLERTDIQVEDLTVLVASMLGQDGNATHDPVREARETGAAR